jgi:hypothetical protein
MMSRQHVRKALRLACLAAFGAAATASAAPGPGERLFADDFERGLAGWRVIGPSGVYASGGFFARVIPGGER